MDERQSALVEEHLPLVTQVVHQLAARFPAHCDRSELTRAGTMGLIDAARRFDPTRCPSFAMFASHRISGAVLDALRATDWAPRSVRRQSREIEAHRDDLTTRLGRPPTTNELAASVGTTVARVQHVEARLHRSVMLSLERLEDETGDSYLSEGAPDGSADPLAVLESNEMHAYLRDAVRVLPERHRLVIIGIFFEGRTGEEMGALLGVTESRVSQIRAEAYAMMRAGLAAQFNDDDAPIDIAERRGRVGRRQAEYAAAVASHRTFAERISTRPLATVG